MNLWPVLALSGMLFSPPTVPGQIPDRVLFDATFERQRLVSTSCVLSACAFRTRTPRGVGWTRYL